MLENQIFGLFQELGPDDDVALLMDMTNTGI